MCNSILSCTQTVGHYLLCCGCWLCKVSLLAFSWGSWEFRITAVCCHLCWVHRQRVALAHSAAVRRDILLPAKDGTQQPLGRVWWPVLANGWGQSPGRNSGSEPCQNPGPTLVIPVRGRDCRQIEAGVTSTNCAICYGFLRIRLDMGKKWTGTFCNKWRSSYGSVYVSGGLSWDLAFNEWKLELHLKQSWEWGEWLHCRRGHCICCFAVL